MHEIGVVIVSFNSGDVILDCLESLLAAAHPALRIVVVDNASTDDTVERLRAWASGATPYAVPPDTPASLTPVARPIRLVETESGQAPDPEAQVILLCGKENLGFAGGVNLGLSHLARRPEIGHFWVLNPDSMVPAASVPALADHLAGAPRYALLGGRVNYYDKPDRIQIDGGKVNFATGMTGNWNLWKPADCPPPDPAQLDFITGASMVVSRAFYETVGPMREDYFLYFEEVDWAMRRGELPLAYCPGLVVYHRAGTSIGSPGVGSKASAFSLYFKHRNRMRFLRRFNPWALPVGYAYGLGIAVRLLRQGDRESARAVLTAMHGGPVPANVRGRLSEAAARLAFAPYRI